MSRQHFATLTPANDRAKAAFDEVINARLQHNVNHAEASVTHSLTTHVFPNREFDRGVRTLRRRMAQAHLNINDSITSDSATEADTDSEGDEGRIWSGYYTFNLDTLPAVDQNTKLEGWTVGKSEQAHMCLASSSFAKQYDSSLRSQHVRFNFDTTNRMFFLARSHRKREAEVAVNGEYLTPSDHKHYMNQHKMRIRISLLDYIFQYSDFAQSEDFRTKLGQWLLKRGPVVGLAQYDMPTPLPDNRTIQGWTINRPLGQGTSGRVSVASNKHGQVAALKILTKNKKTEFMVNEEVRILKELDAVPGSEDEKARIVQLVDVFSVDVTVDTTNPFVDVAIILSPLMERTMHDLIEDTKNRLILGGTAPGCSHMNPKNAKYFCDALHGLRFLHSQGWMHLDLKPQNIGIADNPPRSVLLDLGSARHVLEIHIPNGPFQSRTGGTVPWMSPERQTARCGKPADIWAMGVVGFQLTRGNLPWHLLDNPFRPSREDVGKQHAWKATHDKAMVLLKATDLATGPQDIEVGPVISRMLDWDDRKRLDIGEVLEFDLKDWKDLTGVDSGLEGPPDKRRKV